MTNERIEASFSKAQLSFTSLGIQECVELLWGSGQTDLRNRGSCLYSLYGQHFFSLKTAVTTRNEIVAHLNFMLTNLNTQLRSPSPDLPIVFATESELFGQFLKLFNLRLFESPLFRKVRL